MGLIETIGLDTIIIVLVVCIPTLIKFIKSIITFIKDSRKSREELIEEGRQQERAKQQLEDRFENGEARMTALEKEEADAEERICTLEAKVSLLLESDQQAIKTWIKAQHDKWMPKKYIDSYILELLDKRYAIYVKEDGNSWAEDMVKDLRSLTVVYPVSNDEIK